MSASEVGAINREHYQYIIDFLLFPLSDIVLIGDKALSWCFQAWCTKICLGQDELSWPSAQSDSWPYPHPSFYPLSQSMYLAKAPRDDIDITAVLWLDNSSLFHKGFGLFHGCCLEEWISGKKSIWCLVSWLGGWQPFRQGEITLLGMHKGKFQWWYYTS